MKQISLIVSLLSTLLISLPAAANDACVWSCLAMKVKAEIDSDPALKKFDIQVKATDTYDVKLTGSVDEGEQMAFAGMAAEKVKGIKTVNNDIMPKN